MLTHNEILSELENQMKERGFLVDHVQQYFDIIMKGEHE